MSAAVILQIMAGLGGLVSLWLRDYYSAESKAARKEDARNEAIQQGRQDIADGNVDAVSTRIDSVPDNAPGNPARLGSDSDTTGRLAKITGG